MAWRQTGDKPLSEPMMTYAADAYVSLSLNELKHWGLNKMVTILQMTFWNAFSGIAFL